MNLSFSANFGTPATPATPAKPAIPAIPTAKGNLGNLGNFGNLGNLGKLPDLGDVPSSKLFDRLGSVPSISSGIEAVKNNPITAAPLQITQRASSLFAAPVFPLASLSYFVLEPLIRPIIKKVDTMATDCVDKVTGTIPLITEEPGKIVSEVKHLVCLPVNKLMEEKDYVMATYSQEHSSHGQHGGVLAKGRAVICTQLIVVSDGLLWLRSLLSGGQRGSTAKPAVVQK
ncbi:MAG: hypothetical protein Q9212_003540 [Teloschistes hypoglaucus]